MLLWSVNYRFGIFVLTDIDECSENTDGCKEDTSVTFCTNLAPENGRFACSCPDDYILFTEPGQNGFGMVVQYGEDVDEDPGDTRVVNKSCIRTSCIFLVEMLAKLAV